MGDLTYCPYHLDRLRTEGSTRSDRVRHSGGDLKAMESCEIAILNCDLRSASLQHRFKIDADACDRNQQSKIANLASSITKPHPNLKTGSNTLTNLTRFSNTDCRFARMTG